MSTVAFRPGRLPHAASRRRLAHATLLQGGDQVQHGAPGAREAAAKRGSSGIFGGAARSTSVRDGRVEARNHRNADEIGRPARRTAGNRAHSPHRRLARVAPAREFAPYVAAGAGARMAAGASSDKPTTSTLLARQALPQPAST
jgi:hypothetical protein